MMDIENEYHILERQKILLEQMKAVHSFLKMNNIDYSLCGGSLLGAIREGGFIPWDDDIDIMVDRTNFEKMIKLKNCIPGYKIVRYLWVYRIQSKEAREISLKTPSIDIFVFDNIPDNKAIYKLKVFIIKTLQGMLKKEIHYVGRPFYYKICLFLTHCMGKLISDNLKFLLYNCVSQIGNNKKTEWIACYNDLFKYLELKYNCNLFKEYQDCQFEDCMFMITKEYDHYLTTVYGDYMIPVKTSERIPQHV